MRDLVHVVEEENITNKLLFGCFSQNHYQILLLCPQIEDGGGGDWFCPVSHSVIRQNFNYCYNF
jgi:hypothetical protein